MQTQTFEASSVDKALEEAAGALGVAADQLDYQVEEKASDFWGLGETVYQVTVTVPASEAEPEPEPEPAKEEIAEAAPEESQEEPGEADEPTPAPEPEAAPAPEAVPSFFSHTEGAPEMQDEVGGAAAAAPPETPVEAAPAAGRGEGQEGAAPGAGADLTAEAAGILSGIFAAMGFECTAEAKLDGETMQVAITGEDNQYLLEGRGRGLAALELILNHSFRAWPERAHKRVRVDAGDFRSQRDDEIRDMAYQVAHRAKETSSEQQTSELNPYERRIVHLALSEDPQVTTRSLGNGFLKAVNVIPTQGRHRGDR